MGFNYKVGDIYSDLSLNLDEDSYRKAKQFTTTTLKNTGTDIQKTVTEGSKASSKAVNSLEAKIEGLSTSFSSLKSTAGKAFAVIAAGMAAINKIQNVDNKFKEIEKRTKALVDGAKELELNNQQIQIFDRASKYTGASGFEEYSDAYKNFKNNFKDLKDGRVSKATNYLKQLGINKDTKGSAFEVFDEYLSRINNMSKNGYDVRQQDALNQTILGSTSTKLRDGSLYNALGEAYKNRGTYNSSNKHLLELYNVENKRLEDETNNEALTRKNLTLETAFAMQNAEQKYNELVTKNIDAAATKIIEGFNTAIETLTPVVKAADKYLSIGDKPQNITLFGDNVFTANKEKNQTLNKNNKR